MLNIRRTTMEIAKCNLKIVIVVFVLWCIFIQLHVLINLWTWQTNIKISTFLEINAPFKIHIKTNLILRKMQLYKYFRIFIQDLKVCKKWLGHLRMLSLILLVIIRKCSSGNECCQLTSIIGFVYLFIWNSLHQL